MATMALTLMMTMMTTIEHHDGDDGDGDGDEKKSVHLSSLVCLPACFVLSLSSINFLSLSHSLSLSFL